MARTRATRRTITTLLLVTTSVTPRPDRLITRRLSAPTTTARTRSTTSNRWSPRSRSPDPVLTRRRAKRKRDFSLRRPTASQERSWKKKSACSVRNDGERKLVGGAEGEEILGAFDGFLEAFEEELEVVAALDEVDVGGVDDEEVGGGVAEEEMFVGAGEFLDVFGGDVGLVAGGFLGDAGAEDFGLGLEIDDQIGSGNVGGEGFVVALVELELGVVEIEVGEDAVLFHEEIGEHGAGSIDGEGFAEALLALDEEIHLGAKSGAGLGFVEVGEEGIVLAVVDAAGVEAFGKDAGESSFADAQRAFNDDEAGRLGTALRGASALGGGRVVAGHRFV